MKCPLFVEFYGEAEVGKTYLASIFPKPLMIDTTVKKESYEVFKKLVKDWESRYVSVTNLEQVNKMALNRVKMNRDDFRSVIVDTSSDLQKLAVKEWCKEKGRDRPLSFEYGDVRAKIDAFIQDVFSLECNLVFTAIMGKEYKQLTNPDGSPILDDKNRPVSVATGRRVREGYVKTPFYCDLRIYLRLVEIKDEGGSITGYKREGVVVKNRFRDKSDKNSWIGSINEFSWVKIKELVNLPVEDVVE